MNEPATEPDLGRKHSPAPPPRLMPLPVPAAGRPIPFTALVRVELRRLTDTSSSRLLLLTGPLLIVLLNLLTLVTQQTDTLRSQIGPTVVSIEFGQMIVHATLIKTITGEWLYRGIQSTMLIQPSRNRYFLAQATTAGLLWLGCSALQLAATLLLSPLAAARSGVPYLLGDRIGWVIQICTLGSLLGMLAALALSLLLPNPAAALGAYFLAVPVLAVLASLVPRLFAWTNPFTPVSELATLDTFAAPAPAASAIAFWIALLTAGWYRVKTADID
jgi:hypothetical protein